MAIWFFPGTFPPHLMSTNCLGIASQVDPLSHHLTIFWSSLFDFLVAAAFDVPLFPFTFFG